MRILLALLAVLVLAPQASATRTILVRFADPAGSRTKAAALGDEVVRQTVGRVAVVRLAPGESEAHALAAYNARRDVLYAEPNGFRRPFALGTPNDPGYTSQWALPEISAPAGWSLFPGSFSPAPGAKVGIVDTGVDAGHPDLAPNLTSSGATCVGGCVADNPTDIDGHGTHVAGIAAAAANNGLGVAGLAFSSPIVAVRVFHDDPTEGLIASDADVADGIVWTEQHGARVINLSLGAPAYSLTICNAIVTAINTYHVVVVAAAGNSGSSAATYPASCPGVIGVAATTRATRRRRSPTTERRTSSSPHPASPSSRPTRATPTPPWTGPRWRPRTSPGSRRSCSARTRRPRSALSARSSPRPPTRSVA